MRYRWFACLCAFAVLTTAAGAQDQPDAGKDAAPGAEQTQEKKAEPDKDKAAERSPDTFTPTEEISEDLSVSFPVDI